jgi:hypothetical protein
MLRHASRWPALLALAASLGCSHAPTPKAPRAAPTEALTELGAEPATVAASPNPFAPIRTSPTHYHWERAARRRCQAPTRLRFEGSHGDFPLLPDEAEVAEAPGTWGTGSPPTETTKSAERVVAELRPRLRRCFSSWVDQGSATEATVRFAVRIGCGGEVGALTATSSGVDESTLTCLFGVVARASFESPASGELTLQLPVVFKR